MKDHCLGPNTLTKATRVVYSWYTSICEPLVGLELKTNFEVDRQASAGTVPRPFPGIRAEHHPLPVPLKSPTIGDHDGVIPGAY